MASKIMEILAGNKVICDKCKKGSFLPVDKNIPIEKCNVFKCDVCSEEIRVFRKIKI